MATAQATAAQSGTGQSPGAVGGIIGFIVTALFWLFFSLLLSIAIEWMGMTFWWPEAGAQHSIDMYEREISYLGTDLRHSLVSSDPAGFAAWLSGLVHDLWARSGALKVIAWMATPPSEGASFQGRLHGMFHGLHDYAAAMVFITMVFAVRLAILTLSMSVFVLFGLYGLVDGLTERDIRRFSAGRESAYVFHLAKRAVTPMLVLTWALYLSMPFSLHPAIVILPFAALCALFIRITSATFKKHL